MAAVSQQSHVPAGLLLSILIAWTAAPLAATAAIFSRREI
jgi:ABC-type transport system involved in multi-copper enzyme maturation permease subunit